MPSEHVVKYSHDDRVPLGKQWPMTPDVVWQKQDPSSPHVAGLSVRVSTRIQHHATTYRHHHRNSRMSPISLDTAFVDGGRMHTQMVREAWHEE